MKQKLSCIFLLLGSLLAINSKAQPFQKLLRKSIIYTMDRQPSGNIILAGQPALYDTALLVAAYTSTGDAITASAFSPRVVSLSMICIRAAW